MAPPLAHAAATGTTVYVDNSNPNCSDTNAGTGTQAQPYCTLGKAGLTAQPGETVLVEPSAKAYIGPEYFSAGLPPSTVSGTPGSPITFKAAGKGVSVDDGQGFYLSSQQHDFVIEGFDFSLAGSAAVTASGQNISVIGNTFTQIAADNTLHGKTAVDFAGVTGGTVSGNTMALWQDYSGVDLVSGTSGVSVDHNTLSAVLDGQAFFSGSPGVVVGGPGNEILDNRLTGTDGPGVSITSDGTGTVVAGNLLTGDRAGVQDTGASGVAVAGNTIKGGTSAELSVTGSVIGVSVQNNVGTTYGAQNGALVGLSVDSLAGPGTTADYNDLYIPGGSAYNWGGALYTNQAEFTAISHQGSHDSLAFVGLDASGMPQPGSIAIDSANSDAPGEQTADLLGSARHDDPGNPNTGAGKFTYYDRGAFEFQGDSTPAPPPPPPPPPPTGGPTSGPQSAPVTVRRIGGGDRYATGIQVSQAQWQNGGADAVVLARGDQAPDALAGVPLAAHFHGPLLLTNPTVLDSATRAEIDRVLGGPQTHKTIYILGGESAVSPTIQGDLRRAGYQVVRYGGASRYDTALQIATAFGTTSHVIVATGTQFPDALAAGPLGAVENAPIVLSQDRTLDPQTAAFIEQHPDIDPIGGQAQQAVQTLNTAGKTVNKALAGGDRYSTSLAVAAAVTAVTGKAPTAVGIASGVTFPDALTGGAFAANAHAPLILTNPTTLSPNIGFLLHGWMPVLSAVTVFGGDAAISGPTFDEVVAAVHGKVV